MSEDEDEADAADYWMQRGARLRAWKELAAAQADEEDVVEEDEPPSGIRQLSNGASLLDYATFLEHQRVYDDLKHVDCRYIDFGSVLVEQDKSLGKGGLCWDAAFILAEHVESLNLPQGPVLELGCGTGVCGLLVAATRSGEVHLTDLPELMPLLRRNVIRNYRADCIQRGDDWDAHLSDADQPELCDRPKFSTSHVSAYVLDWSAPNPPHTFATILGADVVAKLYDPHALVQTICQCSNAQTSVYISFKKRLSSLHRTFEEEMAKHFDITIVEPHSRNRNPQVRILVATNKKVE